MSLSKHLRFFSEADLIDIIQHFSYIARVLAPLQMLELVVVSYVGEVCRDISTYLAIGIPSSCDISSLETNKV